MSLKKQQSLEHQIREINHSLKFCDKLSTVETIEHFLSFLYKESRRRFKIKSLVFHWRSGHFGPLQYICHSKGVYKSPVYDSFKEETAPLEIRVKNKQDSEYLAHCLGRPVQNVLSLPIRTRRYGVNSGIYIFVEFFGKNPEKLLSFYEGFLAFITECLDRLLMRDHLKTAQDLWTATFNGLQEPLAVFDEQKELSNSNSVFDAVFMEKKSSAFQEKTIQWNGRVFEKHFYPVCIREQEYRVCHYMDISESLLLRNRMIQNIKMSALGRLGESIAHQLSNPLAGLLSMAQLILKSESLDEETKKDMKDITAAVLRSQDIISNLLDFSRAESPLYICDLNQSLKKTLPFLKSIIRVCDFQVDFCKNPVLVRVQEGLLQQVIFNLVKNACQAVAELKSSHRQVTVRVYKKQNRAFLCVDDNGRGIHSADSENVFKPFFTTKSKKEGTGIGLNISQSIVKSFFGEISAGRSYLGGACFTLSLPLESQEVRTDKKGPKKSESFDCR